MQHEPDAPPKPVNRTVPIAVGVAVLLILGSLIAYGASGGSSSTPDASSPTSSESSASEDYSDSAEPTPIPTPTAAPTVPPAPPAADPTSPSQLAQGLLAAVPTATTFSSGYVRAAFGPAWQDTNHNGCDTRNDVLARDLSQLVFRAGTHNCIVLSGVLADPYTGTTINFVRGNTTSTAVQIDHVVPLAWAWRYGASAWTATQRLDYANDLADLYAVDGRANAQKSDSGPANWMPSNVAFQCQYVEKFVTTVSRYGLSIDGSDRLAASGVLSRCP